MQKTGVLIVGAGHGGAQAALALRQNGYEGGIVLAGREPEPPYERPPLSKEYLAREKPFERLYLRPVQLWADKHIELRLNAEATGIDPQNQVVTFADRHAVQYDHLIWATGGDPRMLQCPGSDLAGIHAVRTRADADAIMAALDGLPHDRLPEPVEGLSFASGTEGAEGSAGVDLRSTSSRQAQPDGMGDKQGAQRIAVVGGGYIGLEAAAVLTKLGRKVVLLEALPRVLARVAGEELSAFYEAEHRAHGVDLRTGVTVAGFEGEGHVTGVRLADGEIVPCDLAIVGIGIVPAVAPLLAAGAEAGAGGGVAVDEYCRTALPNIYAIGDCAAHANGFAEGAQIRLESVQNANDQANTAAKAICGAPVAYAATPWFWSNQYDLKLQTVGLSAGHDTTVLRGDPAARSFSVIYLKAGRVIALDCVNMVRDYAQGRKLVEARAGVDPARLADTGQALKDLLPT